MTDLDRDILRLLPDATGEATYIGTGELYERMLEMVPDTPSRKTVLRRLSELEEEGLIEVRRRGVRFEWRRREGAGGLAAQPGSKMTFDQALALQTLRRFSSRQIPELVAESLSAIFDMAETRLQRPIAESERRYARWSGKVAVEGGGFTLHYPAIDRVIFAAVSRALFEERKLKIIYHPRHNTNNNRAKVILPLGLVEVGGLVYLVGGTEGKQEPTMYRIDRLSHAETMLDSFDYPASFSLDVYVKQQRRFDFMVEQEVQLKLKFIEGAGDHLLETPLSKDQKTSRNGGALFVQGTALLSKRLRWWLRSFGPNVEVLGPASLRDEMAAEAQALARIYTR